jgi:hypothetical protein
MAYLQPRQLIFIKNNKQPITAMVSKVAFRKYWGKRRDKESGKWVKARRSMPYAICEVVMSQDKDVPMGSEFTIAGYMLQNVTVKGEKALAFHSKYEVAFADELGNEWVRRLITEENKHDT